MVMPTAITTIMTMGMITTTMITGMTMTIITTIMSMIIIMSMAMAMAMGTEQAISTMARVPPGFRSRA